MNDCAKRARQRDAKSAADLKAKQEVRQRRAIDAKRQQLADHASERIAALKKPRREETRRPVPDRRSLEVRFGTGSLGCRDAMHVTNLVVELVEQQLATRSAVLQDSLIGSTMCVRRRRSSVAPSEAITCPRRYRRATVLGSRSFRKSDRRDPLRPSIAEKNSILGTFHLVRLGKFTRRYCALMSAVEPETKAVA